MRIPGIVSCLIFSFLLSANADSQRIEQWMSSDTNGDGVLSLEETSGLMNRFFSRNDKDSDGKLSLSELEVLDSNLPERGQGKRGPATPEALPDGISVRKDQVYRDGHERWKLDVYLPEGDAPEGGRPGIVFVHGGGWKNGTKEQGQWSTLPAAYAAKGYVCISLNYRLIGDGGGYPACVHDVKNAVRWFRAHADELGLDPERIGAYGNSAGAHLVSMLGLVKPDADLEGDGSYLDQSSLVQAVCASATPSNFLNWNGEMFTNRGLLMDVTGDPIEQATAASPVTYVDKDAPPFLLIHAKDDSVVPYKQGKALAEKLESAGNSEVELMTFDSGNHGAFGLHKDETYPAMEEFFAKALKLNPADS